MWHTVMPDHTKVIAKTSLLRRLSELVIYFVAGTVIGHYLENVWRFFHYGFTDPLQYLFTQLLDPPLAEPYGIGVIIIVTLIAPAINKFRPNLFKTYIICVLTTAIIEYICALVIVAAYGNNPFWSYSNEPFNIQGYICLENSLLFGVVATLFIYYGYPVMQKLFNGLTTKRLIVTASIAAIFYIIMLILFPR